MRSVVRLVALGLGVTLVGCATQSQYFTPGEKLHGTRAEGQREALYQLQGKDRRFGEARVWSRGSVVTLLEGQERTVLHVGFELNNTSGQPLTLRPADVKLAVVHTDAGALTDLSPHSGTTMTVAPQSIGEGQVIFLLPPELAPTDIRSFRVYWVVSSGEQRYQNNTPFVERYQHSHHHHHGYVIYDMHHPHYWHYRHLGYCYDLACSRVIVVPHRRAVTAPIRRTRAP